MEGNKGGDTSSNQSKAENNVWRPKTSPIGKKGDDQS